MLHPQAVDQDNAEFICRAMDSEKERTYFQPTSCMQQLQCESETSWRPVVIMRSSFGPEVVLAVV